MEEQINTILNNFLPQMGQKSRQEILKICSPIELSGSSTFIKKGKQNEFEYFLLNGVVRSYLPNQEGDLITISFFDEGKVLTPHVIRTYNHKSQLNFENITPCQLVAIKASDFGLLMSENMEIREFANNVLRSELMNKTKKEIQLISQNAYERLVQFREDFNMLENRIAHTMIASYLGVTPVSLSRLRKQSSDLIK